MKPEQQRIAIAKACGKRIISVGQGISLRYLEQYGDDFTREIPDYLNDLNAMHDAEKTLSEDNLWFMTGALADIVDAKLPIAHATAAQRAEAFLRTLNLWIEDK